jgi:hypothetical protein
MAHMQPCNVRSWRTKQKCRCSRDMSVEGRTDLAGGGPRSENGPEADIGQAGQKLNLLL